MIQANNEFELQLQMQQMAAAAVNSQIGPQLPTASEMIESCKSHSHPALSLASFQCGERLTKFNVGLKLA